MSGNPAKRAAQQQRTDDTLTILWASNSPTTNTGYGTQTAQAVTRLARDGHRVAIASNYGTEGYIGSWRNIRIYPRGFAMHSEDVIPAYAQAWAAENDDPNTVTITLYDVWVYGEMANKVPRIASWVPIDHQPAPARVVKFLAHPNVTPLAMSRFGERMINDAGLECFYIPHGLDDVYRATPDVRGMTGRQIMGIPEDAWVITMANANKGSSPPRKAWPENLMAAAAFMHRHPDVWLYIHSEDRGTMGGVDMHALLAAVGAPQDRVRIVDQFAYRMGIPADGVAAIYTASDVLLSASMSEGFGLTPLEAQRCGTRVIVSDWTAQPELVGDGWVVGGQPYWNHPMGAWWITPNIGQIEDALEAAYAHGRTRSEKAVEFAQQYDADRVWDAYWRPALKALRP
jgi:hypothetical protein